MCEHLEVTSYLADAVSCFHQMYSELEQRTDSKQRSWALGGGSRVQYRRRLTDFPLSGFKSRCSGKSEDLGDIAMNNTEYDEAISQYTTALSLDPATKQVLLVKRSMARVRKGGWGAALEDANEVICF